MNKNTTLLAIYIIQKQSDRLFFCLGVCMCLFVNRLRSEDFIQENRLRYSLIHIGGLPAIELWNIKGKIVWY